MIQAKKFISFEDTKQRSIKSQYCDCQIN